MGFLNPAALVYALSIALLVLIYLRARARPTVEISSLILFEEVPAPVAKSRMLKVDALFWLELLTLAAMTLGAAGLYMRTAEPVGPGLRHALVFDLGAGMGAVDHGESRLARARADALGIISRSPANDQFSVITYALEAQTLLAATPRGNGLSQVIKGLKPFDVATRPAALRAALIQARGAQVIDVFSDRRPSRTVLADAGIKSRIAFHQVGHPEANLAIVALDPGVPKSTQGRAIVQNFSPWPQPCELEIDSDGHSLFHSTVVIEPQAELVVPFGPLPHGGLIRARILTHDALAADNERYADAPSIAAEHALILSPDPDVRDDLARILLAINPSFIVTTADPTNYRPGPGTPSKFDLAIIHDCTGDGIKAAAKLFIFPEPRLPGEKDSPLLSVVKTVPITEMEQREGEGILPTPVILGASRVIDLPGWMRPIAEGISAGGHSTFPLAGMGRYFGSYIGVISFDIRHHMLLDPDEMDALLLVVNVLRHLTAPQNLKIVPTGTFVTLPAFGYARLIAPDGASSALVPDKWGRVRFRPLEAGRYKVESPGGVINVMANYYDAAESNLQNATYRHEHVAPAVEHPAVFTRTRVEPLTLWLAALALALILAESLLITRRALGWRMHHV